MYCFIDRSWLGGPRPVIAEVGNLPVRHAELQVRNWDASTDSYTVYIYICDAVDGLEIRLTTSDV